MVKKNTRRTPNSKIKAALRQLWLRSRERGTAIKEQKYTCRRCGTKQSKAKGKEVAVEVHHIDGIDWDSLCDLIRERLLQTPEDYEVLCKHCHTDEHNES